MATTSSTTLQLGTTAPAFDLPDVTTQQRVSLADFAGKPALLVMFICRHCPYVQHVKDQLARIGRDYTPQNVGIVGISSNDAVGYPEDAPESLAAMARDLQLTYPICYDESQEVARAYGAACTPEFFLFDADRKLVYHGQLDDSRPGNSQPVTGKDLRRALDAVLSGQHVDPQQKPSIGCSIKWKS